jgi:hypothetical protein
LCGAFLEIVVQVRVALARRHAPGGRRCRLHRTARPAVDARFDKFGLWTVQAPAA